MMEARGGRIDPFTEAIIRHKFQAIIEEAVMTFEQVSGSPTTAEGHDMMVALYTPTGHLLAGSAGFLHHLSSAAQAVKVILQRYGEEPGFREGDVWLFNDSYLAALHPPDVYVITPIFYGAHLCAWVANFVHVTDIGALSPGGFSPGARDRFQEGFQTPGLKLIEAGRMRQDVMDTILNQVRTPELVALDIRSQIAANNVARDRMVSLLEDYGAACVGTVAERSIAQSEDAFVRRLDQLPKGTWRGRQYVDAPDGLHCVQVSLINTGSRLVFDFRGTGRESNYSINNSYWATYGAVLAPVYPLLAWDIPWNEGIMRCVSVAAPEGSVVNCRHPAPVSAATVTMVKIVNNLSNFVVGKMLDASVDLCERASAVWDGMHCSIILSGHQSDGEEFIVSITDKFAGAGGATAARDGVDLGGELPNCVSRWANAETHELHNPILYKYRRLLPDSGGPGCRRGGVTHEFCVVPHQVAGGTMTLTITGKGYRVPLSLGLSGGFPGSIARSAIVEHLEGGHPSDQGPGHEVGEAAWGEFSISEGQGLYQHYQGGGGYGDPVTRSPELVAQDVAAGLVTKEGASAGYGVILSAEDSVDWQATEERRMRIRWERIGSAPVPVANNRQEVPITEERINAYLQNTQGGVQCTWCGHLFGCDVQSWKFKAARRERRVRDAGPWRDSDERVILREFSCPQCGTLCDVEVSLVGEPDLVDEVESWPTRSEPA